MASELIRDLDEETTLTDAHAYETDDGTNSKFSTHATLKTFLGFSNLTIDNRLVRSTGTTGAVQSSGITLDDSDNVSGVNNLTVGGAFTSLGIDDNATSEVIQFDDGLVALTPVSNAFTVRLNNTDSILVFSGGNSAVTGANGRFFGDSHATQANDIDLRTNTTVRLRWDNSGNQWNFFDNRVVGVERIDTTGGPQIHSGSGTPEGAVTAPVGSIFMRSDGGTSTTLYVKESGVGNTGWRSVDTSPA